MKNEKKNAKSILKRETKLIAYVVACLVVIVIGSSYALFFQVSKNTKNQVVTAGTLQFTYKEGTTITSAGNSACFEPIAEAGAAGVTGCDYELSVQNTGTLASNYQLQLAPNASNAIEESKLKVILKKKEGDSFVTQAGYPKLISSLTNKNLVTDTIAPNTTIVYSVRIFVDEDLVAEEDDGKAISFSINGIGEVSGSSINQ